MADTADPDTESPAKGSKLPMILGVVLALAGGGGAFFAIYSGAILGTDKSDHAAETHDAGAAEHSDGAAADVAYVPVQPVVVSLGTQGGNHHLRFHAQLEVPAQHQAAVSAVIPRVVDVFNSYLRALDASDFEAPEALTRIRAQLLRRVQIVTGKEHVRDLLVMEFMLN